MVVEFLDSEYYINFGYERVDFRFNEKTIKFDETIIKGTKSLNEAPCDVDKSSYLTYCVIEMKTNDEKNPRSNLSSAVVSTCIYYTFVKDEGRKKALAKALKKFPREDFIDFRVAVWNQYFKTHKSSKKIFETPIITEKEMELEKVAV